MLTEPAVPPAGTNNTCEDELLAILPRSWQEADLIGWSWKIVWAVELQDVPTLQVSSGQDMPSYAKVSITTTRLAAPLLKGSFELAIAPYCDTVTIDPMGKGSAIEDAIMKLPGVGGEEWRQHQQSMCRCSMCMEPSSCCLCQMIAVISSTMSSDD
jgi:hypothetical protein